MSFKTLIFTSNFNIKNKKFYKILFGLFNFRTITLKQDILKHTKLVSNEMKEFENYSVIEFGSNNKKELYKFVQLLIKLRILFVYLVKKTDNNNIYITIDNKIYGIKFYENNNIVLSNLKYNFKIGLKKNITPYTAYTINHSLKNTNNFNHAVQFCNLYYYYENKKYNNLTFSMSEKLLLSIFGSLDVLMKKSKVTISNKQFKNYIISKEIIDKLYCKYFDEICLARIENMNKMRIVIKKYVSYFIKQNKNVGLVEQDMIKEVFHNFEILFKILQNKKKKLKNQIDLQLRNNTLIKICKDTTDFLSTNEQLMINLMRIL